MSNTIRTENSEFISPPIVEKPPITVENTPHLGITMVMTSF
jgi:hypothetical protein